MNFQAMSGTTENNPTDKSEICLMMKTSLVLAGIRWNYAKINQITPHLILHNSWKFVMIIDSQSSPTSRHTFKSQFTGKVSETMKNLFILTGPLKIVFATLVCLFSHQALFDYFVHIFRLSRLNLAKFFKICKQFSIQKAQKHYFLCPFSQVYKRKYVWQER